MADDIDALLAPSGGGKPTDDIDALLAPKSAAPAAPKAGAVDNMLSSVYARVADVAGFPLEVANELVNHAGRIFAGKEPGWQGGDAQRAIREAMK